MKKHIAIITAAILALTLTACSNTESEPNDPQSSNSSSANNESTSKTDSKPNDPQSSNTSSANNESTSQTNSKTDNSESAAPSPKEIEEAIAKALGDGYLCTADVPDEEIFLSCIGWLDLTKVDEYVVKQPTIYAQDTVGIVKCKEGYADEAAQILNDRFAQSISYIRQYPFDVAKVEGTRIYRVGDILMYITAGAAPDENASEEDAAKLADEEYKKIDNAVKELFGTLPENLAVIPEDDGNHGGLLPMPDDDFDGGIMVGG